MAKSDVIQLKSEKDKQPVRNVGVQPAVQPVILEKTMKDACPYCNSDKDAEGEPKAKVENTVIQDRTNWQCMQCGKQWDKKALNKPYSIELERGPAWVREMERRRLRETS